MKRLDLLVLPVLFLLLFVVSGGCCGALESVTFVLDNRLVRPVSVVYTIGDGDEQTLADERHEVHPSTSDCLFTSRQRRFGGYQYHISAVNEDGEVICSWTFEHSKVCTYTVTLVVPDCESRMEDEPPANPGKQIPPYSGCGS